MSRPLIRVPDWVNARVVAGGGIYLLTLVILLLIAWKPELAKDDLFKTLAQAIVVQGLVGLAMAHWFTSAARQPPTDPIETTIVNTPDHPVPVEDRP